MRYTATYSPDDNKLRLYASSRLDEETYARVKACGFRWAPKQELFVCPAWSPAAEDLALELAGDVGDEDTTLTERAEERAERFEDYGARRMADAEAAQTAVARIADGIPLGQPILVGHHSERHARKDAERIESGMRRAVKMWETSQYWERRAAGAIRHAKYKELAPVRARRIKGLEADERKRTREKADSEKWLRLWTKDGLTLDQARQLGNYCHLNVIHDGAHTWSAWDVLRPDGERYQACPAWTVEQVQAAAREAYPKHIAWCDRWLRHVANRLTYERAMLAEAGGTVADRTKPQKGGAVKCWAGPRGGWAYVVKVNRVSVSVLDNWGNGGRNFARTIPFDKLGAVMTPDAVEEARQAGRLVETDDKTGFHLVDAPPPVPKAPKPEQPEAAAFEAMRDTLRAGGVKAVAVPQLFPTPADLAARMVELAQLQDGDRVLEPSAGTGVILDAVKRSGRSVHVVAVEVDRRLCDGFLWPRSPEVEVIPGDFLEQNGNLGVFDRIVMNPPFGGGQDVKHIEHARHLLKPGGRLVALCAAGPRQVAALRPLSGTWEEVPAGTFAGTGVRAALLTVTAPGS